MNAAFKPAKFRLNEGRGGTGGLDLRSQYSEMALLQESCPCILIHPTRRCEKREIYMRSKVVCYA